MEREELHATARDAQRRRLDAEAILDLQKQMSTREGRHVMARLTAPANGTPWSQNSIELGRLLGRHQVANELRDALREHCFKDWQQMEHEQHDREVALRLELEMSDG